MELYDGGGQRQGSKQRLSSKGNAKSPKEGFAEAGEYHACWGKKVIP